MKNTVKLSESQLRGIIAESVRKVLSERYLEPGTADYETDKIAKDLKRSYPQYERFVDEYVYGGYYEQYARMNGGYFCVREGFREFVKKKQHGNIAEGVKKVLKERFPDTEDGIAASFAYERQIMSLINECDDCLLLIRIIKSAADKLSSICKEYHRDKWFQEAGQWAEKVYRDSSKLED